MHRPFAIWRPRAKPLLIWIAPWLLLPFAVGGILFTVLALVDGLGFGETPTPLVYYVVISIVILSFATLGIGAVALHREWPSARWILTLAPWAATGLVFMAARWSWLDDGFIAAEPHAPLSMLWYLLVPLYFFGYPPVRRYYAELAARQQATPSSPT
jgi:hypothetical protein